MIEIRLAQLSDLDALVQFNTALARETEDKDKFLDFYDACVADE